MGLFSKKQWRPPQGVTIDQAGVPLGIPAGTILREVEGAEYLWCNKVQVDGLDAQLFYPVTIVNKGNGVSVVMAGKQVAEVSPQALGTAVQALKKSGGQQAPGMLEPGERKISRILVRV